MTLEPVDVCDSMRLMNVSASSDSSLGFFGFLFPFYFFFSEERKEREKNRKEIYRYIDIYINIKLFGNISSPHRL